MPIAGTSAPHVMNTADVVIVVITAYANPGAVLSSNVIGTNICVAVTITLAVAATTLANPGSYFVRVNS
jgi:hypothetical protein